MYCGAGDNTYTVDNPGDVVNETVAGSGGTDLVVSSVSFILPDQVENLALTGAAANGTGNPLANIIAGNAANNVLDGREGHDTLTGGTGRDVFVFDTALNALTNLDTITDFSTRNSDDSLLL